MINKQGFKPVPCKLGEDGNAFAIMSRVNEALRKSGNEDLIADYLRRATSGDYNNLMKVTLEFIYEEKEDV